MFHIQKKLHALLSLLFLISISTFSTAQTGTFDVRMVIDSVDCTNAKLFIDMQVRADNPGQEYFLGDQNYRFSFNRNVLANPALVQELDVTGYIPGGPGPLGFSFYSPHSLTGSLDTIVSYNLELSGGDGIFVTDTDYINVGRMSLDILDFNTPVCMRWHRDIPQDFPKTFVGQNYNGDLIPTLEGSYLDYYQDLSSACSNTAPIAVNDTDTTPEEQAITVCVPTNDSDPENTLDPTSVTLVSTPPATEGTVIVDAVTGCITFTPVTDFNGTVTPFDYQICDLGTLIPAYKGDANPNPIPAPDQPVPPLQTQPPSCVTATVNLTVTPVNDAPVAVDDTETTPEDTPLNSNVLPNDTDPDGDALTLSSTPVTQPANGTVTLNANGTYTYTPNPNFNGADSFEYEVCDGGTPNLCDNAVVNITITSVNDAPVAVDNTETTAEDTPLNKNVLTNDTDPDTGDILAVITIPVVAPANGTLTLNANGDYTYTPNADFNGTDNFEYTVCDNGNPILCDNAVVNITVTPTNDAPVAVDDNKTTAEDTPLNSDVSPNNTDPDTGDVLMVNTTPTVAPTNGSLTLNANGTYTYTPNPNFFGADSFEYEVCDNGNPVLCDQAVVNITVTSVNDAPVAVDDTGSTAEDTPLNSDVLTNDTDPDTGDVLTVNTTPTVAPTNGSLTLNANGTYTYIPNTDFNGTDSFEYQVCDNGNPALCDNAVVTITVTPANDAPIAANDTEDTDEDTPLNADVLTNDTDPDTGDVLSVNPTPVTAPTNGTLTLNTNGTYTYTPNPDYFGADSFEYEVCDDGNPTLCDQAVVSINITSVNDAPVAVDDTETTTEDTPLNSDVTPNDSDPDAGDVLTVNTTPVTPPTNGTVVLNINGTYTYTPNADFNGTDSFEYTICDSGTPVLCDNAVVNITIMPANDAPVAMDDAEMTAEDTPLNGTTVLSNDNDIDTGDVLTVTPTPTAAPTNGTVTLNANGTYTYTPNADFNGSDSFRYEVCDNGSPSLCGEATVTITVTPVNDAPVATDDFGTTPEDMPFNGSTVLSNDTDVDTGDVLSVTTTLNSPPSNGSVTMNANGTFVYTPNSGFNGSDTFEYEVCDDGSPVLCDIGMVTITIDNVNDQPTALDDASTTSEDTPLSGASVLSNDTDIDGNNLTITTTPVVATTNGAVTINANGTYLYTPNPDFNGTDSFEYEVCDDGTNPAMLCDTATVTITVTPVNDAPLAVDDTATTTEDTPLNGTTVLSNDTDVDTGDVLTANTTAVTPPANGTVVINANGTYTYTPNADFNGSDSFQYDVCDNGTPILCATATVNITVTAINDAPVATDDTVMTAEDTALSADVSTNDEDADGDPLSVNTTPLVAPANGALTLNTDGTYTYTPNADFNGTDTFEYEICDNASPALCDNAVVTITITPVNDAPVAVDDSETTSENTPISDDVSPNDSDVDGDPLAVNTTPIVGPTNGTLTLNANGTYTYTPNAAYSGLDNFEYEICDNGTPALCDQATVTISIGAVNDPPVAVNDSGTTPEDTPLNGTTVLANDTDIDTGDILMVNTTPLVATTNGTLILNANGTYNYTPNPNFFGNDSFEYEVCDNGIPVLCSTAIVNITVTSVNDAPVAVDDAETTSENTPISSDVTTNDSDADVADNLTVNTTPVVAPTNGTLTLNANGTYTYTPNSGYSGLDSFEYQICDNGSPMLCDNAVVTISIGAVNDPPTAVDDNETTTEDTAISSDVTTNDSDLDGDNLTVNTTPVTPVTNGTLTLNANGTYTYTPNANFFGADSFEYQICDDGTPVLCSTATVNITITSVNDAPIAMDDAETTSEDTPISADVTTNDSDADVADILTVTSVAPPTNGTLTLNANGTYTYTPNAGYSGLDSFEYQICDNGSPMLCDNAVVTISIGAVNDPPTAVDDNETTTEDTAISSDVTTNDSDLDGDNLTVNTMPVTPVANGTLTLNTNGTYTYTPNANFFGADSFEYQICDDGTPVLCSTATVNITISSVNDAPVAADDTETTLENTPLTADVSTNDSDVETSALTYAVVSGMSTSNGTLVFNSNGTYTYTPMTNFFGTDTFTYEACDGDSPVLCDQATVTIVVGAVNNPPIAKNDVGITQEDVILNSTVAVNDSEPEGDNLIYTTTPISAPASGTLVLNSDGTYTYTPNADFFGLDNFEYEVCDDGMPVMCATAIVTIRVNSVNDAPALTNDQATTDELAPVDIDVVANDSDVEDGAIDPCSVTIATPPTGGTITFGPAPACVLTYTPNSGFYGTDAFEYEVCDNNGVCSNAVVDITVNPVCLDVQLAVWLEGGLSDIVSNAYLPQMRNTLETARQILPGQVNSTSAGQPYNSAPWSYSGTEGAGWTDTDYQSFKAAHSGMGIVDWVLVSFRSGMAANTTFKKAAALVMEDGTVAFPEPCVLTISSPSSIYIIIEHRNHIGVMSDGPVAVNGGQVNYDFRTQDSFTNGGLSFGQKQISAGKYAMYAGDCIQTSDIGGYDVNGGDKASWLLENGIFGNYLLTDINLDGDVNGADKILWFLNNGISAGVPR